jgi:hypothetical protein
MGLGDQAEAPQFGGHGLHADAYGVKTLGGPMGLVIILLRTIASHDPVLSEGIDGCQMHRMEGPWRDERLGSELFRLLDEPGHAKSTCSAPVGGRWRRVFPWQMIDVSSARLAISNNPSVA